MKKLITLTIMAAVLTSAVAFAGTQVIDEGTFFATGANSASVVIPKRTGTISDENMYLKVATNVTVTVWRGKVAASVTNTAAVTSTSLYITTATSNTVGGVTITTSDYVIVGTELREITGVTPSSATVTKLTVAEVTVGAGEPVYIADYGDVIQFSATDTTTTAEMNYVFTGFRDAPVAVMVPTGAGITFVSGRYQLKQ